MKTFSLNFAQNSHIDILSPQLYKNNCNDPLWSGCSIEDGGSDIDAELCKAMYDCNVLAPSINQTTDDNTIKLINTINTSFPKNIGYIAFAICN